jgi:hypothetical protein
MTMLGLVIIIFFLCLVGARIGSELRENRGLMPTRSSVKQQP